LRFYDQNFVCISHFHHACYKFTVLHDLIILKGLDWIVQRAELLIFSDLRFFQVRIYSSSAFSETY
jgi:hypothetical protein